MPNTSAEWLQIASRFEQRWQFPHVLGAIDGKHVQITAPPHCGSDFYNYKGFNSVVLMALADADCNFIAVDVGYGNQYKFTLNFCAN